MRNSRAIILGMVVCCMGMTAFGQDKDVFELLGTIEGKWKVSKNNNAYVQEIISGESKTSEQIYSLIKYFYIVII